MKKILLTALCAVSLNFSFSQVRVIDRLEVLYEQKHYGMVYRHASRLLDKPDYDYSIQPEFYKSLAIFQLAQKPFWRKTHPGALEEARKLFMDVKSSADGLRVFYAHIEHVTQLRKDLAEFALKLKRDGEQDTYDELQDLLFGLFDNVPELDNPGEIIPPPAVDDKVADETPQTLKTREDVVEFAKKQLGVPYEWAGEDPSGFDCSGFTTYVMQQYGKKLPRRSEDQYNESRKVKQRDVRKGDLVFFNNGSGISHVGMIISDKGEPLVMIHSSSSKGVIITEIEKSEYWLKRLYAFGSYVD